MLCFVCGRLSPGTFTQCPLCGAPAPSFPPSPPPLHGRLAGLKERTRKLEEGSLSSNDFLAYLDKTGRLMRETLQWAKDLDLPHEIAVEMEQEMQEGRTGIELYLEGLEDLAKFAREPRPAFLEAGLAKAEEGNRRINRALSLNWETFRNYQQMTEDLITGQGPDEIIVGM